MHKGKTGWRNFLKFQLILMESVDILFVWTYLGFKDVKSISELSEAVKRNLTFPLYYTNK